MLKFLSSALIQVASDRSKRLSAWIRSCSILHDIVTIWWIRLKLVRFLPSYDAIQLYATSCYYNSYMTIYCLFFSTIAQMSDHVFWKVIKTSTKLLKPACNLSRLKEYFIAVDDYAKDGGPWMVWTSCSLIIILCGTNFFIWLATKLKFTSYLLIAFQSIYTQFQSRMSWNSKLINVCFNSSALRLMVKTA